MEQVRFDMFRMALVPARGPLGIEAVNVGPAPGSASIELPGSRKGAKRPYLELHSSPAGMAARALRDNGEPLPVAVLLPTWNGSGEATIVPLPEPPLAIARRSDGIWAVYRTRIVHHDAGGRVLHSVDLAGSYAAAGADDSIWVMSWDMVWHVDSAGANLRGPYPWAGIQHSVGFGESLCMLDKKEPKALRCLAPSGEERALELPIEIQTLDNLLAYREDLAVIQRAMTIIWLSRDARVELPIQGAGLDAAGHAFVSSAAVTYGPHGASSDGKSVTLYRAGKEPREIVLPEDAQPKAQSSTGQAARLPPLRVSAVQGERVLVQSSARALWLEGDRVASSMALDDATYKREVFPHSWTLAGTRAFASTPEGGLFISTTGPDGMAVLRIKRR